MANLSIIKSYLSDRKIGKVLKSVKNEIDTRIRKIEPGSASALRLAYASYYIEENVQKNMILYESYAGRGLICNPYAIFKQFMRRADFKDYIHVWSLERAEKIDEMKEEYSQYGNVIFVQRETVEYCRYLCMAGVLINNLSFPNYYTKKPGQLYINTWHGIPLKTLGFDIPDGRITGLNTIRNFLSVDVFLSPDNFMTEIFKNAFRLEGLFEGHIMESGMPRNDNLFHTDRDEVIKKLEKAGVDISPDKKLVLYAPTWKGDKYSDPDTSTDLYFALMDEAEKNMDTSRYQILVKPHQIVYKHMVDKGEKLVEKFIPATVDSNEILSITDVLVSDYSSIYFDFLASGRPVIFYIPDLKEYQDSRGLYFGTDKLPGPVAQSLKELGVMLSDIEAATGPFKEKYKEEKQWACGNDDGNVCERVIDTVIKKRDMSGMFTCDYTSKKKILLYSGDLKPGKTRTHLENFINGLDYNKYDLTLIVPHSGKEWVLDWIRAVDSRVRVLRRTGTHAATREELVNMELVSKYSKDSEEYEKYKKYFPAEALKRELLRIVGQTHFDYAMDYSKKSVYFSNLFDCLEGTEIVTRAELDKFKA